MTNLVAIITLVAVTNWTGAVHEGIEIGYVVTNHIATLVYDGRTNVVTLKSELGGALVTRQNVYTFTNLTPIWPTLPTNWMIDTQWFNLNVGHVETTNHNTATGSYSYIGGGTNSIMHGTFK